MDKVFKPKCPICFCGEQMEALAEDITGSTTISCKCRKCGYKAPVKLEEVDDEDSRGTRQTIELKIDLERTKKWTLGSVGYVEKNNCDALLLSAFFGAIIEFLGRCLRIHDWRRQDGFKNCFGDFIGSYLPSYAIHKDILWKSLRCEGSHTGLAQSGITLTCEKELESYHLGGNEELQLNRLSLIIFSPKFVVDLKSAVEKFFSDVKDNPELEEKCQKTFNEIYEEGQNFMKEEKRKGKFLPKYNIRIIPLIKENY